MGYEPAVIDTAIFLCSRTGIIAQPWSDAGIPCICVDTSHSIRRAPRKEGLITYLWGDVRTWVPPKGVRPIFVGAFPPCTHVANSGARDFRLKRCMMLRDALETFEACRLAASWSGAPYFVEQPQTYLASIPHIGEADHVFDPYEYTSWHKGDNYTKRTCVWVGNGFVMPPSDIARGLGKPDDRIHKRAATRVGDVDSDRSDTPIGFARAVFAYNRPGPERLKIGSVKREGRFW